MYWISDHLWVSQVTNKGILRDFPRFHIPLPPYKIREQDLVRDKVKVLRNLRN